MGQEVARFIRQMSDFLFEKPGSQLRFLNRFLFSYIGTLTFFAILFFRRYFPFVNVSIPVGSMGPFGNVSIPVGSMGPFGNANIPVGSMGPFGNANIPVGSMGPFGNANIPVGSMGPFGNANIPVGSMGPFGNVNIPVEPIDPLGIAVYSISLAFISFLAIPAAVVVSMIDKGHSPFRLYFGGYVALYLPWMLQLLAT